MMVSSSLCLSLRVTPLLSFALLLLSSAFPPPFSSGFSSWLCVVFLVSHNTRVCVWVFPMCLVGFSFSLMLHSFFFSSSFLLYALRFLSSGFVCVRVGGLLPCVGSWSVFRF